MTDNDTNGPRPPGSPGAFSPDDLLSFKVVGDLDISPDGQWIAYVLNEIDADGDTYLSNIWLLSTSGGAPRQLTFGSHQNQSPSFSPDGSRLAFLSNRGGGDDGSQLHVLRLDGGEAKKLTSLKAGAGQAIWSPDGTSILFSAPIQPDGPPDAPKVITRGMYKVDGTGFKANRPTHLFVVPAEGGEARQLTTGDASETGPAWSPDGSMIAFARTRTGPREAHWSDIWTMNAQGEHLHQVTSRCPSSTSPAWSPDGRRIAFYSAHEEGESGIQLWLVGAGGGDERPLTSEDTEVAEFPLGRMAPPIWSPDGSEIALVLASESVSEIALVSVERGELRKAISDERQITMMSAAPRARRIAYLWSDARLCGLIGTAMWDGAEQRQLANVNEEWAAEHVWPDAQIREFKGASGARNLGVLMLPRGHQGGPLPLLVDVHGGPHKYIQFGFPYHPYWYVLLSRGWAVLALNPVGSGSHGEEFADELRGRWGERDLPEQLAAIDGLVNEGIADGERVAIGGKSYGGYMAAWAIGKTRRFRAAICCAPVTNMESHFGTSDSGYYVDPYEMRAEVFDARERYHRLSPIRCAGNAETPTLIMSGEEDHRCPIGQAEELFAALLRAGKTTVELVLYPGGDHHLLEKGKPSHRVDYNRRIIDWLETFCAERA